MEFLKLRYDQTEFANSVSEVHGAKAFFETKKNAGKSIHFIKLMTSSEKPLLVLVHGSPGSLQAYEDFLKDRDLLEKFDMIATDRSGFGFSDFGTAELSLLTQANLLAEILKDFPERKKILVGHSMGGSVIAKFAIEFPEMTDGLVFIAPAVCPDLEPSNVWRKFLNFPLFRIFTPPALRVSNQEIIPLRGELEVMMPFWEKIDCPVAIIQGEEDKLVPIGNADFIKEMAINSPSAKINKIEGGNHFILWSEIPLIKKEILSLLERIQ